MVLQLSKIVLPLLCWPTSGTVENLLLWHCSVPCFTFLWCFFFCYFQHEPSNAERVTAFVDAASRYISTEPQVITELSENKPRPLDPDVVSRSVETLRQGTLLQHDQYNKGTQPSSVIQGDQVSDSMSESSIEPHVCGSLPQYNFKMSPTNLAAFLALFNITQHRLAGVGFVVWNVNQY